jgi:TM2 domain-containing membrane protein YozV
MYLVHGSDGRTYGPVDSVTLQTWVTLGRVNRQTLITNEETRDQLTASDLPFLQASFTSPSYSLPTGPVPLYPGLIQVPAGTHSVGTAVLLALLITGLGQMYNKQAMKGLVILFVSVILAVCTCGVSILLTHPFAFIDAILIAQRLNRGEAVRDWQCF